MPNDYQIRMEGSQVKRKVGAQLGFDWDAPLASQVAPQTAQPAAQGKGAGQPPAQPTGQPSKPDGHWLRQPWHPCYTAWYASLPRAAQYREQARLDREAAENPDHAYIREFLLGRATRCEEESKSCSAESSICGSSMH